MAEITIPEEKLPAESGSTGRLLPGTLFLGCPNCRESLGPLHDEDVKPRVTCRACGFVMMCQDGIWRALRPLSGEKFRQFIIEYQTIRHQEGHGTGGADYFLSLPYRDLTGRNSWQWKIRGRSYGFLEHVILPGLERIHPHGMDVLDVGAGSCWMSYRLASRGHRPVAVDLLDNASNGLMAGRYYLASRPGSFKRFLAEMDRLPFADAQFDLVAFNASFHYSEDYNVTLKEALRCLRRPGVVLIIDSPFYDHERSGRAMVEEKHAEFQKRVGFRSDSIAGREFLTSAILEDLGKNHGVVWDLYKPWYGAGWALRPMRARLLGRREPAKFYILLGAVNQT